MGPRGSAAGEEGRRVEERRVPALELDRQRVERRQVLQVDATDDRREGADRSPEAAPWIAVNPDSDLIPVSRSAGILHTLAVPLGGTIPGRASVLRMDGWTTEDLAVVPGSVDLVTIGEAFHRLDQRLILQRIGQWLNVT